MLISDSAIGGGEGHVDGGGTDEPGKHDGTANDRGVYSATGSGIIS